MERFRLAVFNTQPPHLYFGGVERRIMETSRRLQSQADITVYSGTKARFKQPTTIDGVKIVPCPSTDRIFPLDNWTFSRSLNKKIQDFKADVYEIHAASGSGFGNALRKHHLKTPLIHTIHGVLADEYEQAKRAGYRSTREVVANYFMHRLAVLEKETAQNATLIVTISKYSIEKIRHHYHIDPGKVRMVPNGVDIQKFKPTQNNVEAKREMNLGKEPCILFVGSLIPRKGLHFLVEAAQKIVKQHKETKFLIVGQGPLLNQLERSLESMNLLGNFKFLGNLDDKHLPTAYNAADVFVLPSVQEGQGIVLLEAQASGVPVVAFNIGGINEAVSDEETGLLVESANTDELAGAFLRLLDDKSLREKMGFNGRRFVAENFTWDICAKRMLGVYSEALSQ